MNGQATQLRTGARPWRAVAGALTAWAATVAGGCSAGAPHGTVIPEPGPARLDEARRVVARAQEAHRAGELDRAATLYRQALELAPDLGVAWNNLGLVLMEQGNYMDAAAMFQIAADAMPRDPKPYYNLGLTYQRRGWLDPALDFYRRALERDPLYQDALRGAVLIGKLTMAADDEALARARRLLMRERDSRWRTLAEREQIRIEAALRQTQESGAEPIGVGQPPSPSAAPLTPDRSTPEPQRDPASAPVPGGAPPGPSPDR